MCLNKPVERLQNSGKALLDPEGSANVDERELLRRQSVCSSLRHVDGRQSKRQTGEAAVGGALDERHLVQSVVDEGKFARAGGSVGAGLLGQPATQPGAVQNLTNQLPGESGGRF
jgi:hypothetical protein